MKNFTFFILLVLTTFSFNAIAQSTTNDEDKLTEKVQKVFELAQKGYDNLDANALIMAAKILINHPDIKVIQIENEEKNITLPNGEEIERHNLFDAATLLMDAKKIAPVDAWIIKKRIAYWEARVAPVPMNYVGTGIYVIPSGGGDIHVKNYLIYSQNSKTIDTKFKKDKKVTLSVRIGDNLKLRVFDDTEKKEIGKSESIGDAQLVSFVPKSDGVYKITIENTANRPNDCYLMIEQK